MVFANPVAANLIDGRFYEQEASYYLSPEKLAGDFSPVRFTRELALFRRHCASGSVLDVGCNTGAFLHRLLNVHPDDYEALGLDVSGPALNHAARLGLRTLAVPFALHDFQEASFDAITFWAVLEHVDQPLSFLRKAATLLKPGGHCFVLVPNIGSLAFRLLGKRYRYVMPEHLNYFRKASLRRLVDSAPDLRLVDMRTTHFNPIVLWQDLFRPENGVSASNRAALLNTTNSWKTNPRLPLAHWMYARLEHLLGIVGWADNITAVLQRKL